MALVFHRLCQAPSLCLFTVEVKERLTGLCTNRKTVGVRVESSPRVNAEPCKG